MATKDEFLNKDSLVPSSIPPSIQYGSDVVAEQLSRLDIDYIALVPGSSYRGLHDSIVNLTGNQKPEMLITLHEEHAVSIAHGYAKVTGTPMAVGLHANVGLMHATMAIFNAFCDRVPILMFGATGPLDARRRRPWIDWIHTAQDQGALIRPYIKFDDQPHSAQAAVESVIHAYVAAKSRPCAPTYVCLDLGLQEDEVDATKIEFPETSRYLDAATHPPIPSSDVVLRVESALSASKKPLFMFGRPSSNSLVSWQKRTQLADKFDARVITDIKQAATFPSHHRLHAGPPGVFLSAETCEIIREADLIISFDWIDLAGNLKAAEVKLDHIKIVHISIDSALHNGWSKDHFAIPPADIFVHADVDTTVAAILAATHDIPERRSKWSDIKAQAPRSTFANESTEIFMPDLAQSLYTVIPPDDICLVRVPLGWSGRDLRVTHPLGFMGMDGAAGIGSGCGQIVGTSLALRSKNAKNLVTVGVIGDGDFLMGSSALWTAVKYGLPCLVIVANNGSYFNDEVHQERVAKARGRVVENKWTGMRLTEPQPDCGKIAEGLGCAIVMEGRVEDRRELEAAIRDAVRQAREGKVVVLDVNVRPDGYGKAMTSSSGEEMHAFARQGELFLVAGYISTEAPLTVLESEACARFDLSSFPGKRYPHFICPKQALEASLSSNSSRSIKAGSHFDLLKLVAKVCPQDYASCYIFKYLRFLSSRDLEVAYDVCSELVVESILSVAQEQLLYSTLGELCHLGVAAIDSPHQQPRSSHGVRQGGVSGNFGVYNLGKSFGLSSSGRGHLNSLGPGRGRSGREGPPNGGAKSEERKMSSKGSKRIPCICHIAEPGIHGNDTTKYEYMSHLERHLRSHDIYICCHCLEKFTGRNKAEADRRKKDHRCVKQCSNSKCRKRCLVTPNHTPGTSACTRCIESSKQQWEAIFRLEYPGRPIPSGVFDEEDILSPSAELAQSGTRLWSSHTATTTSMDEAPMHSDGNSNMIFLSALNGELCHLGAAGVHNAPGNATFVQQGWHSGQGSKSDPMDYVESLATSDPNSDEDMDRALHDQRSQTSPSTATNNTAALGLPVVALNDQVLFGPFADNIDHRELAGQPGHDAAEDVRLFSDEPVLRSTVTNLTQAAQIASLTEELQQLRQEQARHLEMIQELQAAFQSMTLLH
ncbi:hypothetical protein AC579_4142 [Pseudocercospora musae]|uniref:Uncharacterized protein n=1 Tax=Pseudocercospora musae TaxID=113226 RepID=A0A139I2E7_9PEZI|nr:hypothetical protein AC579_4142 [Pseudocercospora musae]